jgi:hypothetical protein
MLINDGKGKPSLYVLENKKSLNEQYEQISNARKLAGSDTHMYQLRYTAKYLENELPYNKLSYIKFIL